jgi:hypothetical protein
MEDIRIKKTLFLFIIFLLIIFFDSALGNISYPRIANFFGTNLKTGMSKEQLDFISRYSLIVIGGSSLHAEKELSYIKSKNPQMLVLYSISVRGIDLKEKEMRSELWLHDPEGQLVSPWPGRYLPNQVLPEVNKLIIEKARKALMVPQIDGIFLDSFSETITYINKGQLDSDRDGKPDDPIKLNKDWAAGLLRIAYGIRAIKPGIIIMANGWAPLNFAYNVLNGILFEDQLKRLEDISNKSLGSINIADDLLTAYQKWQNVPNFPHITAFVDGGGVMQDPWDWSKLSNKSKGELINNARSNTQMMRLNLCFTLMGEGYAAFDYGTVARGQKWWFPEWDIKLGAPIEPMQKLDGYWQRKFEHGVIYVNPYPKPVQIKEDKNDLFLLPFDGKIITK